MSLFFAVLRMKPKKMLDRNATWREKYVLGGVKFFNDITITHSDSEYFQKIFEA